jgi:hypothetical protein
MAIKVVLTKTRTSTALSWDSLPDDVDRSSFIDNFYADYEFKQISSETTVSPDGLTLTVTSYYETLDDFIIEDSEDAARNAVWRQIHAARSASGITNTITIYDADNQVIDKSTVSARENQLRTEGRISP